MKAECTWGDGPDVLLSLDGKTLVLLQEPQRTHPPQGSYQHGYITKAQVDLTADEAIELAHSLMKAASQAMALDNLARETEPYPPANPLTFILSSTFPTSNSHKSFQIHLNPL